MSWHLRRRAAVLACRAIQAVLPPALKPWGQAIQHETDAIADDAAALVFALQSVFGIVPRALAWHLLKPFSSLVGDGAPFTGRPVLEALAGAMIQRPRVVGMACATGSVALGLVYLAMAGAPARSLGINAAALVIGLAVLALLGRIGSTHSRLIGASTLTMAATLLATAMFGVSVEGAARWVQVSGFSLQPSLILVPAMLVAFARCRSHLATAGVIVAAVAMAIQPDRAMAGMIVAGLAVLAFQRTDRFVLFALATSLVCFVVTIARPDTLPAAEFVDQVLRSSFEVHALAGVAVMVGVALLLVPAVLGWRVDPADRGTYATFGAAWLAAIMAAGLGNYPTPIVGYGASAIIGYVLSLLALPRLTGAPVFAPSQSAAATVRSPRDGHLLVGGA